MLSNKGMSSGRKPMKPSSSTRSGSGRPAGGLVRETSASSLKNQSSETGVFNSKEATEYLSAKVLAAQELIRQYNETPEDARPAQPPVFVYQGEQRAWGGTRAFNPVKDDFLQLVEIAVDTYKQQAATETSN